MRLSHVVLKELWYRKLTALILLVGIVLCIAMVVAVQRVSLGAIDDMRKAMLQMGKNLVILPQGVTEDQYWAGEFGDETAPLYEKDVRAVARYCIHEHKPKILARHFIGSFQRPVEIDGRRLLLSGIMVEIDPAAPKAVTAEAQKPVPDGEAELGSAAAAMLGLKKGGTLRGAWAYRGKALDAPPFTVRDVRKETGTVEDFRVFVNSDAARQIFGVKEKVVNVIEAVSCMCSPQSLPILAKRIEKKLAGLGRPVQAKHAMAIVEARRKARVGTVRDADVVSVAVLLFGVLLVAGYSALNAHERRQETGVLLAIAARPRHVAWAMLQKMLLLGLIGGVVGCWLADVLLTHRGMALVQKLHPAMRSYVLALTGWEMYAVAVGLALALTALPGLIGVLIASRTDPAKTLQER